MWALALTGLGYFFGDHLDTLKQQVFRFQQWLLAAVVLLIIGFVIVRNLQKKRRARRLAARTPEDVA
jgi:membrane protein DedA with SNARE-associated domain